MSRPFAVFDIDGTLIRWQLYHAIADALVKLGYINTKQYQAVKEARMVWKRRAHQESFKAYERALVKAYDQMITELTVDQFTEATTAVFEEYKDQVHIYTRKLIAELKARSYLLFAISGSQKEIVDKIATYYGFDDCVGSEYVQIGGRFTGGKKITLGDKHRLLEELAQKHHVTFKNSIAVGDSEGDITMLEAVEHPIAFNPSLKLYDVATKNHWQIVIERKNVVYELEYRDGSYLLA